MSASNASSASGKKNTHWTSWIPAPKATKMAVTTAVNIIDSQR